MSSAPSKDEWLAFAQDLRRLLENLDLYGYSSGLGMDVPRDTGLLLITLMRAPHIRHFTPDNAHPDGLRFRLRAVITKLADEAFENGRGE